MPAFFFTNTLMLAGLAALGIPVLIHLLLKRKKKQVQFSTIRFFQLQDEQSSRRRKLRNWLLLALRLLILALLVLAFSRPYARQNEASAADRKQVRVVFVLDNSASMLATGTEGQRWTLAKDRIQKVMSTLNADDSAALVECATHANVLSGFAPPASVMQVVRDLLPAYGTSSIADGLQQAVRLLSSAGQNTLSSIYLVTDLQKSACRSISSRPVPQNIEVRLLPVGDVASPNIAIVRLDAEPRDGSRPQVVIASFSDEDSGSVTLEFAIDNQSVSSQVFNLKAGSSTNIDLLFPPVKPGWHDLKASLRARDALEADNSRYACFFVPEPARVLVVEPRTAAPVFEQETFFLASALDPAKDSTNSVPGAFSVTQVTFEQLPERLTASKSGSPWNVVILPGLKDLAAGSGKALGSFVENGGGLVLFLSEDMSANRYNSELHDLLPVRVVDPDKIADVGSPWRIAFYDTNSMVFSAFRQPNSGDLRIPEFAKRYTLEPVEGATRLAFFEDGVPLLVTRSVGRGRVALVNTSADTQWNDWPKHKTFVPFLHGLTKYVAQTATHDSAQENNSFIAGEDFDLETGTAGRLAQFTLRTPNGKEVQSTADEQGRLRDPLSTLPGVYSLRDKAGHEIRRMALNLPPQESDLEALRPADFQQQLVRVQENPKQTLAAGLFGARNDRREFWTALLLGALILLLVEPFVANRTSV
jgi:aerotolerance regulator-like protein/VWA domain-containing protein